MALNRSTRAQVEARRQTVARLRIDKGYSQRQIAAYLSVSLGTVNRDLMTLDADWRKAAGLDTETYRAQQLAEIERVKRWAWLDIMGNGRMRALLQAIQLEAKITGTIQPPSYTFNFAVFQQFLQAKLDDGMTVGEAFGLWFKDMAERKQEDEAQHENTTP